MAHRTWIVSLALYFTSLPAAAFADTSEPPPDPWYSAHVYVGLDGCLAIKKWQTLRVGDRVVVFDLRRPTRMRTISYVVNADSIKLVFDNRHFQGVYEDKPLWNRIGCYWGLRAYGEPFSIGRFEPWDIEDEGLPLAIEGLPDSAVVFGADGTDLEPSELLSLAEQVRTGVPEEFRQGRLLRTGKRYGPEGARDLVEMYMARPFYNAGGRESPIDSVHICHLFLNKRRLLGFWPTREYLDRKSGSTRSLHNSTIPIGSRGWTKPWVSSAWMVAGRGIVSRCTRASRGSIGTFNV
jgi:hypothetical protein